MVSGLLVRLLVRLAYKAPLMSPKVKRSGSYGKISPAGMIPRLGGSPVLEALTTVHLRLRLQDQVR